MLDQYVRQVRLLLSVLPDIAREAVFALKCGAAINLFYRDMPRLSVDIDLPCLPVADRDRRSRTLTLRLTVSRGRSQPAIPLSRRNALQVAETATRAS